MLNVIQYMYADEAVAEKEYADARKKVRAKLQERHYGTRRLQPWELLPPESDVSQPGLYPTGDPAPLPPETLPTDDFTNPFPGLEPPVG